MKYLAIYNICSIGVAMCLYQLTYLMSNKGEYIIIVFLGGAISIRIMDFMYKMYKIMKDCEREKKDIWEE